MFKEIDKMGVIVLMAHLIITLVIAGGYIGIYAATGNSDETLKLALFSIIGYWFGAVGTTSIRKPGSTSEEEVKKGA